MPTVLIANRGEIALRVIRACAVAGHRSVAVCAEQDLGALHAELADETHVLPGTSAADTYLNAEALLSAARAAGADAIHPGYGFLSESAEFAAAVEAAGLIWIGPTAEAIRALGDKVTARQLAQRVGAPLAPGIDRPLKDASEVEDFIAAHGLPVVIKAAHGGGGRGMKVVREAAEAPAAFEAASREAREAFGRGECFVERFLERPRHVEVQVLGDGEGTVIAVGDRDCSAQRRNQKLVEEAPAPDLSREQRERLHRSAERICAEVGYRGAGTVEFLLGAEGTMTFLEVNTRLQVEHPVTEAVTGVDLVAEQLRVAFGEGLSLASAPEPRGHAVEVRVNAEDPGRGFLPSPGRITALRVPGGPGMRWDSGVTAGDAVQPAFDSLMAKLIVHGPDRETAIRRTRAAVRELQIEGPATVLPCALAILEHPDFCGGPAGDGGLRIHTQWIESVLMPEFAPQRRPAPLAQAPLHRFRVEVDGRSVELGLPSEAVGALLGAGVAGTAAGAGAGAGAAAGGPCEATSGGGADPASGAAAGPGARSGAVAAEGGRPDANGEPDPAAVPAPVTGTLVSRRAEDGARVEAGEEIAMLSAMKMETPVTAHTGGTVTFLAEEGALVEAGEPLARIED
ncbi:acetyl/propionyl/methylcrotonyl-CoA carboxylase subunit alpha [Brevibacterium album]|uniref:acetyl/propionyl/methylcrotonyl-CoA carboxylase subunit alpha n=1 Tax=Brevibacterium album TaxID=417948 RepID=UPI00040A302A|nr:biotin carboxylase N-terminal domain-containing protein [Brevibacterium album]